MAQAPTYIPPVYPGTNIPAGQPLPAGATVDQLVQNNSTGFNAQTFVGWVNTIGQAAKQANIAIPGAVPQNVNFGALASQVAAGAAAGAAIGGVGAIVGAAAAALVWVGSNFNALFNRSTVPDSYGNNSVRSWGTAYLPNEVLQWCIDASPNGRVHFQTIEELGRACLACWLEKYGAVLVYGQGTRFYSGVPDDVYVQAVGSVAATRALYATMGVDYDATVKLRNDSGNRNQRNVAQYAVRVNLPEGGDQGGDEGGTGDGVTAEQVAAGVGLLGLLYLASRNA